MSEIVTDEQVNTVVQNMKSENGARGVFISIEGDVVDGSLEEAVRIILTAAKKAGVVT